jgi:hypothetical protein
MSKYKLGDVVWLATTENTKKMVACPDCFGKKYLTVILGDGSQVTIECASCQRGYEKATGSIETYEMSTNVFQVTIDGVESQIVNGEEKNEYRYGSTGCSWHPIKNEDIFDTKEEAEARAIVLVAAEAEREQRLFATKIKDHKKWAWHVSHYRQQIRKGKRDIEDAEARLRVAIERAGGKE